MAGTVGEMTTGELQAMIEAAVEKKLLELLGDPDEGVEVQDALRRRLREQQAAVEAGERGAPLDDAAAQLGLK